MQTRHEHHGIVWIDLESPTVQEVAALTVEFDIDPNIAKELLVPTGKPRTEFRELYLYTVFHFPALRHTHRSREQEIDFIVGKHFLITAHHEVIDPIHKFAKVFDTDAVLNRQGVGEHAGFLFFYIMRKLYRAVEHEIEHVRNNLSVIEEHIFAEHYREMVHAISRSSRDLLNLRQGIEPHRDLLREFEAHGKSFFGEDFAPQLHSLSDEYYRIHNHVMRETESLHELRETNNSLLTTRQNETTKIFTVLAFFTFPLSLMAAIFGMNTVHTPVIGTRYDFWIVISIMAFVAAVMWIYVRKKKWL